MAEVDGRLQMGDHLVSVNGVPVSGQSVQFAVQQLTGVKQDVVKIGVNHVLPTSPDLNSSPLSLDSTHPFFAAEGQSIIDIRSQDEEEEEGVPLKAQACQVSSCQCGSVLYCMSENLHVCQEFMQEYTGRKKGHRLL